MNKIIPIIVLFFFLSPPPFSSSASPPVIAGPDMKIINNNIIVNLSITDAAELEEIVKSGIDKEIVFTVELLRAWNLWPDEFVVSKQIRKRIKYDNLREQYSVSVSDGQAVSEKHFKNYFSLKDQIFVVRDINLANIKELEPGKYYIRMVVESRSIEQLPFLGFLMLFIPEVEMSLAKESELFNVGAVIR